MIENPKRHIYHGDGKGKTTAAVGLCVRAAGHGNRILFCSFLKDGSSGEVGSLKKLGVDTGNVPTPRFTWLLTADEMIELKANVTRFFGKIQEMAPGYDLIVLDEVLDAVNDGLLSEDSLLALFGGCQDAEIVLTGRDPSARLLDAADYVTEMKAEKHPFTKDTPARDGIEK